MLCAWKVPPNKHKHVQLSSLVRYASKLLSPLGGVQQLKFIASFVWVVIDRCVEKALITFWPLLRPLYGCVSLLTNIAHPGLTSPKATSPRFCGR